MASTGLTHSVMIKTFSTYLQQPLICYNKEQTTHKTKLYTFCHHIQLRMTESALQNKYDHVNHMNESVTRRKSCQKTGNLLTQQKHLGLVLAFLVTV